MKEKESNEEKRESTEKKELTPQEIQKRKKMLVYPLLFLLFVGAMWLIFAPSGEKNEQLHDGFNTELPIPKDEGIVADKRVAYEQEIIQNKQNERMKSLQDFSFMFGESESQDLEMPDNQFKTDIQEAPNYGYGSRNNNPIRTSTYAYQDINRQLGSWYDQPATEVDEQAQLELQWRIQELERKQEEKSAADEQLELIEKSYAIAAKYMPNTHVSPNGQQQQTGESSNSMREKVIPKPVSQVHHNVVSLLAAPMDNDEFIESFSQPRNMEFHTAAGKEAVSEKNGIRACIYQTIKLSDGKEVQLRLLEPMRTGTILIPMNTILTGSAKISGERLHVTVSSIHYNGNVIPVEIMVYDLDGMPGFSAPNSDEVNAAKEIAANMGTQMGSSITISDDAGSQLAADLGRSVIQGASQYVSKKMRKVEVTLKANYQVLLIPKT